MYSPKADAIAYGELPCGLIGPQSCVVKEFCHPVDSFLFIVEAHCLCLSSYVTCLLNYSGKAASAPGAGRLRVHAAASVSATSPSSNSGGSNGGSSGGACMSGPEWAVCSISSQPGTCTWR